MGNLVWKVLSLGAGIVASKAATTVATKGWKAATGKSPRSAKDPNAGILEAAIYAAISTGAEAATLGATALGGVRFQRGRALKECCGPVAVPGAYAAGLFSPFGVKCYDAS